VTGNTNALFTSTADFLDGPKLSAINSTSWDWWYFDVVSPDLKNSITIVFYTALSTGVYVLIPSSVVTVVGIYPQINGNTSFFNLDASEAIITTINQGASGVFNGTGSSFTGSPDLSEYTISINSPENGVVGSVSLKSIAPAHYPCGPAVANQNMQCGPNIGWANAIPDAIGKVNFTLNGAKFALEGVGYHDKNWSPQPFTENVGSWYWGHARIGPYSLVWFDFLDPNGTESVSLYLAEKNRIIASSCGLRSIKVRPWGGDDTYPPTTGNGLPAGFGIKVDLGRGQSASFNVTISEVGLAFPPTYAKFIGGVEAVVDGKSYKNGTALFEQFKLVAKY
jgi:hypothetical protein